MSTSKATNIQAPGWQYHVEVKDIFGAMERTEADS